VPAASRKPQNEPEPQVAHPDEPQPEEENEVTTTADILGTREIEVSPVQEPPAQIDPEGMVVIRMNTTLEDFTYGNPHMHFRLEEGKRYRMPVHIARYLDGLGYVWH
jgi:hypothetical protein